MTPPLHLPESGHQQPDTSVPIESASPITPHVTRVARVPGLIIIDNVLTHAEEQALVHATTLCEWVGSRSGKRRTQPYVPWREDSGRVVEKSVITPLPEAVKKTAKKILSVCREHVQDFEWEEYNNLGEDKFTELQINEYFADTDLKFHKDNPIYYLEIIFGVSTLADCEMSYKAPSTSPAPTQDDGEELKLLVPARSLYLMTGDSRYKWKHGIQPGSILNSDKRISFTYRFVMYTRPVGVAKSN